MKNRSKRTAALLTAVCCFALVFAGALAPAAFAGKVVPKERFPLRGEAILLTVQDDDGAPIPGAMIEARYRPNSETTHSETFGPTAADGSVSWTPVDAGLVSFKAHPEGNPDESLALANVAVRFGTFPGSGLAMMCIAGLLLFGGSVFGFLLLLESDPPREEAETPST